MGGLSKKRIHVRLKMKRKRTAKLRELKRAYKKIAAAERAALLGKAHKVAPYLTESYFKD